jgi:acyl-[acyl-carrier-protein]-phospholipid O-acyltransferase/long-chain-fatty-acid--[acyl-carrier-protein] ligase
MFSSITKKWFALLSTQFMGVFNDNLLKGAVSFICVSWVAEDQKAAVLAAASGLLMLPFILFSPLAARLSMKYNKATVVSLAKLSEVFIMVLAFAGFAIESLGLCLFALLLMGVQSALYSPAKYGLIRDVGGEKGLAFGTGMMEMITFVCVLLGMVAASALADLPGYGTVCLGALFMVLALSGWWTSTRIDVKEEPVVTTGLAQGANPISFARKSLKIVMMNPKLGITLLGLVAFWFMGSLFQLNLLMYAPEQYGLSASQTGLLLAGIATGVGFGCWLSGVLNKNRIELGWVPFSAIGMAGMLLTIGIWETPLWLFSTLSFAMAVLSGMFKVPLNAWIQERIKGRVLGQVLGFMNMGVAAAVMISAVLFNGLQAVGSSSMIFVVAGVFMSVVAIVSLLSVPDYLLRLLVVGFGRLFYNLQIKGLENIPKKSGALVVANHGSFMDFVLLLMAFPRQLRFVMLRDMYEKRALKWMLRRLHMIPINARGGENDLRDFNEACRNHINNGHIVCIFAEGTVTRTGQILEFKKGIEHIMEGMEEPVIPVYLGNLQGTPFTFKLGSEKTTLPSIDVLFRKVFVDIGEPVFGEFSSFGIRQKITELESANYAKKVCNSDTLGKCMIKALRDNDFTISAGEETRSSRRQLIKSLAFAELIQDRISNIEKVGTLLPKSLDTMAIHVALHRLGLAVMPCDASWSPEQQLFALNTAECDTILTSKDLSFTRFVPVAKNVIYLEDLIGEMELLLKLGSSLESVALAGKYLRPLRDINKYDTALIIARKDENNAISLLKFSHENILTRCKSIQQVLAKEKDELVFSNLSWNNAFGYTIELVLATIMGSDIQVSLAGSSLGNFGAEVSAVNPSILLVDQDELTHISNLNLPRLNRLFTSQAPLNDDVVLSLRQMDVAVYQSVGMNETTGIFAINTPDYLGPDIAGKIMMQTASSSGTVGRPLPGTSVRVVDPLDFTRQLRDGEVGRILIRSISNARAYVEEVGNEGLRYFDEWLVTSMLGSMDRRGFLSVQG